MPDLLSFCPGLDVCYNATICRALVGHSAYWIRSVCVNCSKRHHVSRRTSLLPWTQESTAGVPYVQCGRKTCSTGHKREQYRLIMTDRLPCQKSEYIFGDWDRQAMSQAAARNITANFCTGRRFRRTATQVETSSSTDTIASCRARYVL